MRREGYELTVGRPRVLLQEENGQTTEPMEDVIVDVDADYAGIVVSKLSERKAELRDIRAGGGGKQRLFFRIPTRGLIGYHGEFLTDTRGTGVLHRLYAGYGPFKGPIPARRTGVLISANDGVAMLYSLFNLADRGPMFINPTVQVYEGMIVGEHTRENDLIVNVTRTSS